MTKSVFLVRVWEEGTSRIEAGLDLYEVADGVDLKDALEDAFREYLSTPEGKGAVRESHGTLGWGDLVELVPKTILAKYGVKANVAPPGQVVVVHNDWPVLSDRQEEILDERSRGTPH